MIFLRSTVINWYQKQRNHVWWWSGRIWCTPRHLFSAMSFRQERILAMLSVHESAQLPSVHLLAITMQRIRGEIGKRQWEEGGKRGPGELSLSHHDFIISFFPTFIVSRKEKNDRETADFHSDELEWGWFLHPYSRLFIGPSSAIFWGRKTLFVSEHVEQSSDNRCVLANCPRTCLWIIFQMACFLIPDAILFEFGLFLGNSTRVWRTDGRTDGPTDGHTLL